MSVYVADETAASCPGSLSVRCVSNCLPSELLSNCELHSSYQVTLRPECNLSAKLIILWLLCHLHHAAKYDYYYYYFVININIINSIFLRSEFTGNACYHLVHNLLSFLLLAKNQSIKIDV